MGNNNGSVAGLRRGSIGGSKIGIKPKPEPLEEGWEKLDPPSPKEERIKPEASSDSEESLSDKEKDQKGEKEQVPRPKKKKHGSAKKRRSRADDLANNNGEKKGGDKKKKKKKPKPEGGVPEEPLDKPIVIDIEPKPENDDEEKNGHEKPANGDHDENGIENDVPNGVGEKPAEGVEKEEKAENVVDDDELALVRKWLEQQHEKKPAEEKKPVDDSSDSEVEEPEGNYFRPVATSLNSFRL